MAYKAYLLALAIKMMALPKLPVLISQSGCPKWNQLLIFQEGRNVKDIDLRAEINVLCAA